MKNAQQPSESVLALAEKLQAKKDKQAKERTVRVAEQHKHALVATLAFDPIANKIGCKIKCVECGDTSRTVYTSDLWQVKRCTKCQKAHQADKRKTKQAEIKEAMAFLKNQKGS